jgi:type I restriction enzyme M protein
MADQRPNIDFLYRITNDVLWNTFKKNEIGDVMLPFVVLRRLDCILEPQKAAVRAAYEQFEGKVAADRVGANTRAGGGAKVLELLALRPAAAGRGCEQRRAELPPLRERL